MTEVGIVEIATNSLTLSDSTQQSTDANVNPSAIKHGAKIGMAFNAGPIDHPVYKTANLSGVVPFIMPHGQYSKPAILEDQPRLQKFVADMATRYRNLWPNDTKKVIATRMWDYVVTACLCSPLYDISSPVMRVQIENYIYGFTVDDLVDNNPEDFKDFTFADVRNYYVIFANLFSGAYQSYEDLPEIPAKFRTYAEHIYKSVKYASKQLPGYTANSGHYLDEIKAGVRSHFLLTGVKGKKFSPFLRSELDSKDSGMSVMIELAAVTEDVQVPKEVRDDVMFQRLKIAMGCVSGLMNDVLGLPRDIRLNQVVDSSILSKVVDQGVPLQQALEEALTALEEQCNDTKLCAQILRESYPESADLEKFIRIVENMLDGQLHSYSASARYGALNLKLVEIPE